MADDDEQFELSGELDSGSFASDLGAADLSEEFGEKSAEPLEESAAEEVVEDSQDAADEAVVAGKSKGIFTDFNIFDAMLMVSFLLITVASVVMLFALADYGGLTNAWRTTGISVK